MNEIPSINASTQVSSPPVSKASRSQAPAATSVRGDTVEISDIGQRLSALGEEREIRLEKVQEIREAIANGTYETPDKLDATISKLLNVLRSDEL